MGVTDTPVVDRGALVASFDLADHPIPTGREEAWRFTPLRRLRGLHDGSAVSTGPAGLDVSVDAASDVIVETVGADDPRVGSTGAPDDRVEAQVVDGADQVLVVSVPRESVGGTPTVVSLRGLGVAGATYSRLLVEVGAFADAVVVVDHTGGGTHGTAVEVVVGDGARLRYISLHDWDTDTVHVGRQRFRVGRDARVTGFNATLGGDLVRVYTTATYDGPGGDAELLGVFFADEGQHLEHRLFVDHEAPSCRSDVAYKGALQGKGAHSIWIGDVLIRAAAVGTEHLRDQPQPAPHRRRSRRLGAEPGDRDRRDRRCRARERHRPLRRRAAVLPAVPRHHRDRGPPAGRAWASSPTSSDGSACPRSRSGSPRPSRPSSPGPRGNAA